MSAWARAGSRRATDARRRAVHPTARRHRRHVRRQLPRRARSRPRSCDASARGEPVDVEVSLLAAGGWIVGPDITFALNNDFEMPHDRPDGRGAGPLFTWYECADGRRLVLHDDATRAVLARGRARARARRRSSTDERFDTPEKRDGRDRRTVRGARRTHPVAAARRVGGPPERRRRHLGTGAVADRVRRRRAGRGQRLHHRRTEADGRPRD